MTNKLYFVFVCLGISVSGSHSQINILSDKAYKLSASIDENSAQFSNSITDIIIVNDALWLGTGKGLSRSTNGGNSWENYYETSTFGKDDIAAIAVRGKEVWAALAHSVDRDGNSLPEGGGLRYSSDGGETWTAFPQPQDTTNIDTLQYGNSIVRAIGVRTAIQNVTYDIAVTRSAVWITSWGGMARKSTDKGNTWERVILPPDSLSSISIDDTLVFDLSPSSGKLGLSENLNHIPFSVIAENDSTIWIGTAGGINKTTDGGKSWKKFSETNQDEPISGNFVVALALQQTQTGTIVWAATEPAEDETRKRAVSFTTDGGVTWKQTLIGEFAHNFGFKGDTVYVPTDNGIFRSADFGETWIQTGTIYDKTSRQRYTQSYFYSAASYGDTVWLGGADGLVSTIDNASFPFGSNWSILHASQPLKSMTSTYAFPNPFAPDDETVRIHYTTGKSGNAQVTVRVFDFGMNLVRTIIQNTPREPNREHDELWNGQDNNGKTVANGIYFYHVIVNNDEPRWGKILVIR